MTPARLKETSRTGVSMDKINQRIATELGVAPGQVVAAVELLGEGVDGPVHRPLPQGEDRRPRRYAVAQAGGAAVLPARAGGSPRIRAQDDRRAGQADARAGARHQRRGDQGGAGRPLRALQGEAAHQGADRPRGRPRAAERRAAQEPRARPARRRPPSSSTPARASPMPRRLSTARAISSSSASPRRRRWSAACANGCGATAS